MERPEKFYGKPSEGFEKTKRLAAQLLELCQTAAPALPEDLKDACRELEQRYEESTFRVVVLRMFSRGKSTFLNALIGRRLLYESDREATGAITLLRNSPPLYRGGPFTGRDGLSEEQAQVIRQAMDQTGAVIFLVLPESLEAVGDAFYTRMLQPEGSPSQEELRRRSWFDAFRQVLARRLEQLRAGQRQFTEAQRQRLEEVRAEAQRKLHALYERQDFFDRRLLQSFPTLKSARHSEALAKLREYLENRKQPIKENKEM